MPAQKELMILELLNVLHVNHHVPLAVDITYVPLVKIQKLDLDLNVNAHQDTWMMKME